MPSTRISPLLLVLALSTAACLLSGCHLLESEPVPAVSNYALDLPELRRLAHSRGEPLPTEVRLEQVAVASLPGALMMAGKSWDGIEMRHGAFQVLWPDGRFVLIDAAQDRAMHEAVPGGGPFDDAAWERLVLAMESAQPIVITHEHPDHLGGVARHPRPEAIASRVKLSAEQLVNREALDAIDFPETLRKKLVPFVYADATAIAPGVVLKKAAGHTPGSQMVFVTLADGRELLFVGDVVWNLDAITELRYRTRLITDWIIGEDREAAIHQLRALRDLHDAGEVEIVIAHDRRTHERARIEEGFVLPDTSASASTGMGVPR